ncbi:MAG: hypothetical protein HYV35_00820 [Lentisphaerae bacterium]|nr:hypothetical protein [Lentisphaerota bacterium]
MGTLTGEARSAKGGLAAGGKKNVPAPVVVSGLVFELEQLAVPGQHLLFEACQKVLKDKQIVLTPALWSRFGLAAPLAEALNRLLATADRKPLSGDKLALEAQEAFLRAIARPTLKLNGALDELLREAARANIKVGALSLLPGDRAQALLAHLGLQERVSLQVMAQKGAPAPTAEGWLMTCKAIGVSARCSVALASSAQANYAALGAGLRCVVIPNEFTSYQDFGGADLVVEDLKELRVKDLHSLLRSCSFR